MNVEAAANTTPIHGGGPTSYSLPLAPAPPTGNQCDGIYNGTFNGNVNVSSGQNCAFSHGAGVDGSIQMNGGVLVLNGTTVHGNVQIQKSDSFYIGTSNIQGDVQVQLLAFGSAQICGTTVKGNVQAQNNSVPIQIGGLPTVLNANNLSLNVNSPSDIPVIYPACAGNTVGGNVQVGNNPGLTQVVGNTVKGTWRFKTIQPPRPLAATRLSSCNAVVTRRSPAAATRHSRNRDSARPLIQRV